jgi:hypothetical protein
MYRFQSILLVALMTAACSGSVPAESAAEPSSGHGAGGGNGQGGESGEAEPPEQNDPQPDSRALSIPVAEDPRAADYHIESDGVEVFIGREIAFCEDPRMYGCGDQWILWFVLPKQVVTPASFDLSSPDLHARYIASDSTQDGMCSGGKGVPEGTVEIDSFDASSVSGHMTGLYLPLTSIPWAVEPAFDFVAPRCQ